MSKLKQMNTWLEPEIINEVESLAERHFASKADAIRAAIRTLAEVMGAHETYADQHEDDIGQLYMRLAREMPAGFVEVPKDGLRIGRAGDLPAVLVNSWLVFPDRETGALLAEEQGGEGRIARIVDGEIKPLKMPTPGEVALN
jgi:hypothetical protein